MLRCRRPSSSVAMGRQSLSLYIMARSSSAPSQAHLPSRFAIEPADALEAELPDDASPAAAAAAPQRHAAQRARPAFDLGQEIARPRAQAAATDQPYKAAPLLRLLDHGDDG